MSKKLLVSGVMSFATATLASAQDWPQWRGPSRDGTLGVASRASWPAALRLAWKVTVGVGHASPVVAGERVYVFSRDEANQEVLACLELADGKTLWRQAYSAPYTVNPAAASHGKGPKSTPLVAGGRVFTLGIGGILSAYDAQGGKPLWRHDFTGRFKATSPLYGTAMSPVADADRVFAHVGGPDDGALIAFDASSGAERWAWKGDGPGYASPVIVELGGVRQLVTQTQGFLVGLSVQKGELLWKTPFTTAWDQNAVTPVVAGDLVIYSGVDKGVHALRVANRGAALATAPAWDNEEVSNYMSTPVLQDGVLYGLSQKKKGQFFALDAQTGRTLWLSEGRQGDNAAVVAAGSVLLMLTTDSALVVAKTDKNAFSVVRTYTVADSATWAAPAISGDRILVKDKDNLALWRVQ